MNQHGKSEFMISDETNMQYNFNEKKFQLSIHLSGGIFQSKYFLFSMF